MTIFFSVETHEQICLRVQGVRSSVPSRERIGDSHEETQGRETLRLLRLWKSLRESPGLENSHAKAHR